ncbi:hypothetical protein AYR62_11595 [Secundilactobacillus paracollinoides]|uniref:GGDEF domain-containing protein n=1 Tax=Secundilactobacillus paracollinoides TaxID=240427 RepID=UPI00081A880A|nr:sensor domain-containing diguanylate cyclase [Secundilactobacillus paracollinoides]ANZ64654.1 hypothetical protein AYR62_11595 [Secundilactobacillus paracollinoides]
MTATFSALPYWLWGIELGIAAFFMFGFLTVYLNMTRRAFDTENDSAAHRLLWRVGLVVLTFVTGIALNIQGDFSETNSLMYYSLAVFVFVFPLTDEEINFVEYAIRAVGVVGIGLAHHMPVMGAVRTFGFAALLAWVVVVYLFHKRVRHKLLINLVMSVIYASLFWLTLPPTAIKVAGTQGRIETQGMMMYIIISTGVFVFWNSLWANRQRTQHYAKIASFDALTHAKSFSLYQHEAATMFADARVRQSPFTMVELDVDHFKIVNDQYGHLAGNKILIQVATTLKTCLKQASAQYQVYRTGGEEFTLALPNTDLTQALPIVTQCWQSVRKQVCHYEDQAIQVTISMGVSQVQTADKSVEDVYKRADDSLYVSKRNGRDTITVDGQTRQVKLKAGINDNYAFFVQGVYDDETADQARIRNELTLYHHDNQTNQWEPAPATELSVERLFQLIREAVVNLVLQRVQLPIPQARFLDAKVIDKLSQFMRSSDGPETLTLVLMQLPDKSALQAAVHAYHLAGIDVILDVTSCEKQAFAQLQESHPFDGLKYTLPATEGMTNRAKALLSAQAWYVQALEWAIPIIIGGIKTKSEVDWAQSQAKIHLLIGDYYETAELPIIG